MQAVSLLYEQTGRKRKLSRHIRQSLPEYPTWTTSKGHYASKEVTRKRISRNQQRRVMAAVCEHRYTLPAEHVYLWSKAILGKNGEKREDTKKSKYSTHVRASRFERLHTWVCSFCCWLHVGDLSPRHVLCFLFSVVVISYGLTDFTSLICILILVCGGTRPDCTN